MFQTVAAGGDGRTDRQKDRLPGAFIFAQNTITVTDIFFSDLTLTETLKIFLNRGPTPNASQ